MMKKLLVFILVFIATLGLISCADQSLERIEITTPPGKTSYEVDETFDTTGMVVTAYFKDGSSKEIKNFTFSPNGPLKLSDTNITISYKGLTATQKITVVQGPIKINSVDDFQAIYNNLSGNFVLTADIDFEGAEIAPIGTDYDSDNTGFMGTFDGRGFALKNFTIKSNEAYGNTLFRRIESGAVVKNLAVINISCTGRGQGLLVGNLLGTVENIYIEGNLSNTNWDDWPWGVGGSLFGRIFETGVAKNIITKATVPVGGAGTLSLGGVFINGTVQNCFIISDGLTHGNPANEQVLIDGTSTSIQGVTVFNMNQIETIDFSPLPSERWDKPSGSIPALKH